LKEVAIIMKIIIINDHTVCVREVRKEDINVSLFQEEGQLSCYNKDCIIIKSLSL